MSFTQKLSNPKALIVKGKFCLPTPTVMRGSFEATLQTQAIDGSLEQSLGVATAKFANPHGFTTGQLVRIYGASVEEYNGWKQITVVDPFVFTYSIESSAVSPDAGAPFATRDIMQAIGTGTFAGSDFVNGDWMYIPSLNELRQVASASPQNPLRWSFVTPFSQDVSAGELIRKAPRAEYKGVSVKNIGDADGIYKEVVLATTDLAESNFDQACLEPVCGDATDTTFKINIQ